jgi:GNAT superfamily N-acetyltransferase
VSVADGGISVRLAGPADLAGALACYARNGYGGGVAAGDHVLVAERAGRVVGVVRLTTEHGHRLLRGFFLDEAERGRGLGTRMLARVLEDVGKGPCWLVCGTHLVAFYGRAGFAEAPAKDVPPHLVPRAASYAREHGPQAILRRAAAR